MALAGTAVIECRPGNGSDLNSGGFVPGGSGTDRTQSNTAFLTFDGVTITATSVGVSATITLTGYTVIAGDVDNYVRIVAGTNFTAGLYRISSVSTGLNTWTLDRNCTSGIGAAMVGRMGGALATLSGANSASVSGNTIWIQNTNAHTITTAVAFSATTISVKGYVSSRGDSGVAEINCATNSINLISLSNCSFSNFWNIKFKHTAVTRGNGVILVTTVSRGLLFYNCEWDGCNIGIRGDGASGATTTNELTLIKCNFHNSIGQGVAITGSASFIISLCSFHDNGGAGCDGGTVNNSVGFTSVVHSLFYNNGGTAGLQIPGGANGTDVVCYAEGNVFWNNVGAGLKVNNGNVQAFTRLFAQNNISGLNTTYGIDVTATTGAELAFGDYNAYYSNTTAPNRNFVAGSHEVTLSGNPFNNSASGDFTLNGTAGAGAACKQAGYPVTTIP